MYVFMFKLFFCVFFCGSFCFLSVFSVLLSAMLAVLYPQLCLLDPSLGPRSGASSNLSLHPQSENRHSKTKFAFAAQKKLASLVCRALLVRYVACWVRRTRLVVAQEQHWGPAGAMPVRGLLSYVLRPGRRARWQSPSEQSHPVNGHQTES